MAELKIESEEDFEKWLKGKPKEVSAVLASRNALRILPNIVSFSYIGNFDKDVVFPIFGMNAFAFAMAIKFTQVEVVYFSTDTQNTISRPAEHAARTAVNAASAVTVNVTPAIAHDVAFAAKHAALSLVPATTFWDALTDDCFWLESEGNDIPVGQTITLAGKPLWAGGKPVWAVEVWNKLSQLLIDADESWRVWINWYEARLEGLPTIEAPADILEKLDLDIALIDKALWEEGPLAVNAEVQRLIDEALAEAREREEDSSQTMRDFILHLLEKSNRPMSIEDVSDAFESAGDQHPPSSIRGRLNELTGEGEILRVDTGMYASLDYEKKPEAEEKPLLSEDDILNAVSPTVGITEEGKLAVTPNPITDKPVATDGLPNLPIILSSIIRAILNSLPANSPPIVKSAFEEYLGELNTRGVAPILGLLEAQATILQGALADDVAEDNWRSNAQSAGLEQFFKNHALLLDHFPLREEREDIYKKMELDLEGIQNTSLRPEFTRALSEVQAAHEAGITTDEYFQYFRKLDETAGIIDSSINLDQPVPNIKISEDDRFHTDITREKSFFVQSFGFLKQSLKRLDKIKEYSDSPTIHLLIGKLGELIEFIANFISNLPL